MPRKILALAFFLLAALGLTVHTARAVTVLPTGFSSEAVITNLTGSTTIAFAADGRVFIGQKDGRVRVFQNSAILPTDFINISADVGNNLDRGLIGIALHPDFPNTPYVYLAYTYDPPGVTADGPGARVARVLRVTADPNNTSVALPGSGVVLLGTNSTFANIGNPNSNDGPPSCESGGVYVQNCIAADERSHTVGTLIFGTDGSLFVSSGDGASFNYTDVRALRALNIDSLNGKILRIDPITGQGLPDNPFYNGDPNSNRSKVYDLGLRNPFRTTINTLTNQPFIGDVGLGSWEEINTGRGKNFGWPCYEGNNTGSARQGSYEYYSTTTAICNALYSQGLSAVQAPLYSYDHSQGDSSIQAGAFYRGSVYPPQYQGALFIADYNADWIRYLTFDGNGNATVNAFGTDVSPVGGIVQLLVGPDTNLYYVAYNGPTPNTSEVRRIRYTAGGNTPPTASASADTTSGYVPLTVNFSSAGSFDPDAQPITYAWNFGDGSTATGSNPSHTYTTSGNHTATLTVTDSLGVTGSDTVLITIGNLAPVATIISPSNTFTYNTGDTIHYSGTGVDNEDGNLGGASLQWNVLLHHNQHIHFDFLPGLTGNTGSFVIPDHGDNSWLELCLVASDSGGLYDQKCVSLQPNTVTLSFNTQPSGLELEYDGVAYTTPFNVSTIVNSRRDLIAPPAQACHNFSSWSDGGASSHQILIGPSPQTFMAAYAPCPVTVTVSPGQSKIFGNADTTFTYGSSNPGVIFSGALSRAPGENVGTYGITQGTLAPVDSNYAITSFVPANFTINKATATITLSNLNYTYNGSQKIPTVTTSPSGLANGITYNGSATAPAHAGSYAVVATISDPNYKGTASGTLVIAQATVQPGITANNKAYDGTTAATIASRSLTGVLGLDNVSLTGGTASFASPNVGTWLVTASGLTLSGSDAANYQLSSTSAIASADITQATPTVTTAFHNASHTPITSAPIGTLVHAAATVSGSVLAPTGSVTFTTFANSTCAGSGVDAGTVTLAGGVSDPSSGASVTGDGLSFRATYNGDANYSSQTGSCVTLETPPEFTSADNATFTVDSAGSFMLTTRGTPTVTSVSLSGALPSGVNFTDNLDGTAELAGTPAPGTEGIYNLTFTASNGIFPDSVQNFTLTVNQFPPHTTAISGSTVAGATLSYIGDTSGSTEADASGHYSITVPSGWNGTVTPSYAGCTFNPTDETYSNVTVDMTGQDYAATCSLILKSVADNDGWVLESGDNTKAGGSMNSAATTFKLGDDAANKQYRGILSFNTSTLPDNAVIDSLKLRIKKSGVVGSDPFSSLGKIMVDMKMGSFSNSPSLQKGDFQAAASQSNAALILDSLVNGWYNKILPSGSFDTVNLIDTTQFRLRFETDDNNNFAADDLLIFSGNAAANSRPQLVITYHTP